MSSNRISSLLAWCAANGIVIDPRIEVVEHDTAALSCSGPFFDLVGENTLSRTTSSEPSIRVCSRREHIDFPCTLVYIPKTAVLSAKSCFFAPQITPIPYGHGAQLTLALALYGELLRGSESRWFGYLQSLPRKTVDIAAFWAAHVANLECCVNPNAGQEGSVTCSIPLGTNCSHCTRIHDERNARAWLGATEAEKELRNLLLLRFYWQFLYVPVFRLSSGVTISTEHYVGFTKVLLRARQEPVDQQSDIWRVHIIVTLAFSRSLWRAKLATFCD
ncbi:hypothetical protein V8B97DRAFT_276735 [Scleroderma yunnanense]